MPGANKNKRKRQSQNVSKKKNNNPPRKKRKTNRPKGKRLIAPVVAVHDPCNGPIVSGIYGSVEGLVSRVKNSHNTVASGNDTCGAVFWVPSYNGGGSVTWNMVRMVMTNPAAFFLNSVSTPMGTGAVLSNNGFALTDPANAFISNTLVKDSRTTAACLQLTYTGKVTESAGQIAWISNYSLSDLLSGPNINQMFDRATKTSRLGLETYEVKFRPDVDSGCARFRGNGLLADYAVSRGVPGTSSSLISEQADMTNPKVIGFAWRGCEPGVIDSLVISTTKIVEWRVSAGSGLTGTPQTDLNIPSTSNLLAELDQIDPGWAQSVMQGTINSAGDLVSAVYSGLQTKEGMAIAGMGYKYLKDRKRR